MKKRALIALAAAAVTVAATVGIASGQSSVSAFGYGTITSAGNTNQFYFDASTGTNGSGGSGTITVFDTSTQHFVGATVSCLYVNPSTGVATIWGNTDSHTNSYPPGPTGSVLIKASPGSGTSAGLNVRTYYKAAPTTCGNEGPGTGPITAGVVQTSSS